MQYNFKIGLLCLLLSTFGVHESIAQQEPQTIIDKEKRIQFTVPGGWTATEKDFGYQLDANETNGFILIELKNHTSLSDLKLAVNKGITQEDGTLLTTLEPLTDLGSLGVMGLYQGKVDGKSVKGYLMAIMPPSKSRAVITIIVVPKATFDQSHIDELTALFGSIIFL